MCAGVVFYVHVTGKCFYPAILSPKYFPTGVCELREVRIAAPDFECHILVVLFYIVCHFHAPGFFSQVAAISIAVLPVRQELMTREGKKL